MLKPILYALAGACAGMLITATTALGGSGVGGVFNLGEVNTVNAQTTLSGNAGANPQLRVENSATVQNAFGVLGRITAGSPAAQTAGVRGINSGTNANGFGVWGFHQGSGVGVFGETAAGTGVLGKHTGTTGVTPGIQGETASGTAGAAGVLGTVTAASPGADSAGVMGTSAAANGYGVFGRTPERARTRSVSSARAPGGRASWERAWGHGRLVLLPPRRCLRLRRPGAGPVSVRARFLRPWHRRLLPREGLVGGRYLRLRWRACLFDVTGWFGWAVLRVGATDRRRAFATGANADGFDGQAPFPGGIGGRFSGLAIGVLGQSSGAANRQLEGDVHVTGKLTRAYTSGTANQAAPTAYAAITNGGSVSPGQARPTSPAPSTRFQALRDHDRGRDHDINSTSPWQRRSTARRRGSSRPRRAGQAAHQIFDLSRTAVQNPFTFITYKP